MPLFILGLFFVMFITAVIMRARRAQTPRPKSTPKRPERIVPPFASMGKRKTQIPHESIKPKNTAQAPRFKRRAKSSGLTIPEDAREVATIMLLKVAKARGNPLSQAVRTIIGAEIMHHFGFDKSEADALIEQAEALEARIAPAKTVMKRMTNQLQLAPNIGQKELVDVDAMLIAVSEAEGEPTRAQLQLIEVFRQKIGLRV